MPSSSRPYQSKLLKFVLQQFQQGFERQQRAWRQLQSTATWGAQVAVFPLYAVISAVKRASFALNSASPQSDSVSEERLKDSLQIATAAKANVTDLEHSFTAILTHTQQLLSAKQLDQATPSSRVLSPKGNPLHVAQTLISHLVKPSNKRPPHHDLARSQPTALSSRPARQLTPNRAQRLSRSTSTNLLKPGYTLASSLTTRRLVVVNPRYEVFDVLTPAQQSDLKHYIFRVMHAYWQARSAAPRQPQRLSVKTILALSGVFFAALPMEFKKAWSQLPSGPQPLTLPPLSTSSPPVKRQPPYLATPAADKPHRRRLSSNSPDAVEATAHTVHYMPHPLERVLRWIDRLLTWCEHQWQRWVERDANIT